MLTQSPLVRVRGYGKLLMENRVYRKKFILQILRNREKGKNEGV